jgi:hypothetical protein
MRIVLFLFYRLTKDTTEIQKKLIYTHWYLDTTKLLNLCLIYGPSNKSIVKKIVQSTFECHPIGYRKDF